VAVQGGIFKTKAQKAEAEKEDSVLDKPLAELPQNIRKKF